MRAIRLFGVLAASLLAATGLVAAPSASAGSAATGVCTGVSSCLVMGKADIDGDGRADQIGIVNKRVDGVRYAGTRGSATVRVRTATGKTLTTSTTGITWYSSNAYFDEAPIDGRGGSEIIIGTKRGALLGDADYGDRWGRMNWSEFRVITYRDGKLTTLQSPAADSTSGRYRWRVYASGPSVGFSRVLSSGRTFVVRSRSDISYVTGDLFITRVTYRWTGTGWSKYRTTKAPTTDAGAHAIAWWRMSGIRRYTQCGEIIFTPQSDDMALGIGTVGVSCTTARSMVRAADSVRGTWDQTKTVKGFECRYAYDDTGLSFLQYTCKSGRQMVSWSRY